MLTFQEDEFFSKTSIPLKNTFFERIAFSSMLTILFLLLYFADTRKFYPSKKRVFLEDAFFHKVLSLQNVGFS